MMTETVNLSDEQEALIEKEGALLADKMLEYVQREITKELKESKTQYPQIVQIVAYANIGTSMLAAHIGILKRTNTKFMNIADNDDVVRHFLNGVTERVLKMSKHMHMWKLTNEDD